jgi:GTPase Era involved in 16S rRNA processing
LDLQVKVNKNWKSSDKQLKKFGYNQKWNSWFKTLDL